MRRKESKAILGVAAAVMLGVAGAGTSANAAAAPHDIFEGGRRGRELPSLSRLRAEVGYAPQAAPRPGRKRRPSVYDRAAADEPLIERAAARYGVDPGLLWSLCMRESAFRNGLVSPAGARGKMQFMPGTARRFGIDPDVPAEAFDGAARYVRFLLDYFGGDVRKAVAAYNSGEIAVRGWSEGFAFRNHKGRLINARGARTSDGLPPYAETRAYVAYVYQVYRSIDWSSRFSPRLMARVGVDWGRGASGAAARPGDARLASRVNPRTAERPQARARVQAAEVGSEAGRTPARSWNNTSLHADERAAVERHVDEHSGARYVVRGEGGAVKPGFAVKPEGAVKPEAVAASVSLRNAPGAGEVRMRDPFSNASYVVVSGRDSSDGAAAAKSAPAVGGARPQRVSIYAGTEE